MKTRSFSNRQTSFFKFGFLLILIVFFAIFYSKYGTLIDLNFLAEKEDRLREYEDRHAFFTCMIIFLTYSILTGLSLPGASLMTLISGWLLGFLKGLFVVSFASTTGATLAFLMSRFFFREAILKRWGDHLEGFNQALKKEGAFYLFSVRLLLVIPFFVINLVMGLTPIKTSTYWWVSQVGMLPATAVYVYVGASLPSLKALAEGTGGIPPQLFLALILLGLLPITARTLIKRARKCKDEKSHQSSNE